MKRSKMQYNFRLGWVVTFGFCSVLVIMVVIGIISKLTTNKLVESSRWVSHTYEVEADLEDITKLLVDAETGQRGFILTQKANYLEPYNASVDNFEETFDKVEQLIHDNPEQLVKLNQVKQLAKEKMAELTKTVDLMLQGKRQEAMNIILSNEGKQIMDEIRSQLAKMIQVEDDLLAEREQVAKQAIFLANLVSWGGTLSAIGFGSLVLFFIARKIIQPINQVASTITSSSNEITATLEQQERTATQQAASVNETTATMDELSASAQQSAQQAEMAFSSTQQALNLAEQGNQALTHTLEGILALNNKVSAVAHQMLCLNEQTQQIGNISGLVSDLANQTNMLALNAAVEAVRAGEQGKGFAVVATEIRKLADQSKKSAQTINVLVNDIQASITSTVGMTDESTKTANQGAKMAEQAVEVLASVTEAVNSMVLNIQQISLNANQQATAVQQISQAMNALNVAAQETANSMSQTRLSTHQLNDAAFKLQSVV